MKSFSKDVLKVFSSNAVILLSGVLSGLVIPKIMNIDDYGLYKTFALYTSYTGLCQIGFLDGIVIKYGGFNYDEINKKHFSDYFRFFFVIQLLFGILIASIAIFFMSDSLKLIFLFWAVYLIIMNTISFYQVLSRITLRFGELAVRNLIQAVLTSVAVLFFLFFYKRFDVEITYQMYITSVLAIYAVLASWYIVSYKEISLFQPFNFGARIENLFKLIKNGIPVMFAYFCSSFILILDRQFVNLLFDKKTYAVYAFAYTLLVLINTALSAVSNVIYPHLKRINASELTQKYSYFISILLLISSAGMLIYYPLNVFISWYLPKYVESLVYFRIVLPGVVICAAITIVMQNYYIALNKGKYFFRITFTSLILAFILNLIAYYCFKTALAISAASIIVAFVWYVLSERYFVVMYKVRWKKNLVYLSILSVSYYFISAFENLLIAFAVNVSVYAMISILLYKEQVVHLIFKRNNC